MPRWLDPKSAGGSSATCDDFAHTELVSGPDRLKRTALHYAARDGDTAAMISLLEEGLDPHSADANGWTPLHFAAQQHSLPAVERLLAAGAPANAQDRHGNAALWVAVFNSNGRGEVIRALLEHGADPDLQNNYGATPRTAASSIANYDVATHFD